MVKITITINFIISQSTLCIVIVIVYLKYTILFNWYKIVRDLPVKIT